MEPVRSSRMSVKEYIVYETNANQKFEFHNGEIFAQAGGSIEHALLVGNIYSELRSKLSADNSTCKPITSEAKLHIKKENRYLYPDTMVICGPIERAKETRDGITNPTLIVEVLSKSTVEYDKGDKFYFYRQIPTMKEYVLIEQNRYVVEVYSKSDASNLWSISRFEGLESTILLKSINIKIEMKDLYFDVPL